MTSSLFRALFLAGVLGSSSAAALAAQQTIEVFKSPTCGCCEKWIEHLQQNGFKVDVKNVADVAVERKRLHMPEELASCHVGKVNGYTVEGHVPAADIHKLLRTRPKVAGIAVPGMPPTSPGMDLKVDAHYDTLLVREDGKTRVFVSH